MFFVSTAEKGVVTGYCEGVTSGEGHFPNSVDLPITEAYEGKLRVVITPCDLVRFDVEGVAIADGPHLRSRGKVVNFISFGIKGDQSGCADRRLPAKIAKDSFIVIASPYDARGGCLNGLNSVT